jgi:hypothetical protein
MTQSQDGRTTTKQKTVAGAHAVLFARGRRKGMTEMNAITGRRAAVAVMVACLAGTGAQAALVDNGNSLIDTATNLEWLDLTETQGQTVNQVLSSSFVTVDGYAYATTDQVATLFANAGFVTGVSDTDPLNDPAAALLLSGLGCTQFCSPGTNATGRGWADFGGGFNYRPFYANTGLGAQYAIISLGNASEDFADETAGVYLVRTVVPVPAALWLFVSAFGLLGWFRRRQV